MTKSGLTTETTENAQRSQRLPGCGRGKLNEKRSTSSIRNLNLDVAPGPRGIHSCHNPIHVPFDHRPPRVSKDHDCDDSLRQVLLIADVFISCYKHFEGRSLRLVQQFAVAEGIPAEFLRLLDRVAREEQLEWRRGSWSKRISI